MDPAQYAAYQQQQQQQGAAAAGNNGQQRQQAAYYGQDVDEDEFLGDDDVDLIPADYSQQPAEGYIDDAHSGECARTSRQAERATQAGQAADWLAASPPVAKELGQHVSNTECRGQPGSCPILTAALLEAQHAQAAQAQAAALAQVPDPVRKYIVLFHQAVSNNSIPEISSAYEGNWNRLTEKYYQKTEWPEAEVIAPLVGDGECGRALDLARGLRPALLLRLPSPQTSASSPSTASCGTATSTRASRPTARTASTRTTTTATSSTSC